MNTNMPRYLGQHFLINRNKIKHAVEAMEIVEGDVIIEIGPGHGELTGEIIKQFKNKKIEKFKIFLIEKDKKLADDLKEKFKSDENIEIIEGDVLKILPDLCFKFQASSFKIVGNIPYYITGYLFRIIGELENKPSLIVFTIQKEVAERICALKPSYSHGRIRISRLPHTRTSSVRDKLRGSERYSHAMNLLAASVQFWSEPKIISYVSKKDFRPAPKVDSAIIKLTPKTQNPKSKTYYQFIKILFKQPRKTILNNLSAISKQRAVIIKKEEIVKKLQKFGINPTDRPQNLDIDQIIELSTLF